MELYLLVLAFTIILSTNARVQHNLFQLTGCSATEREFLYGLNGEEIFHSDFKQEEGVCTIPDFADPLSFPGFYEQSIAEIEICKSDLATAIKVFKSPPEEMEPPETSIYPRNDVILGVENTLICHVTGFFPPPVAVSWSKNNVNMTEGVSLSQYRPRGDQTFHVFSSLKITPEVGDIYSCTVNHRALQGQPQTKLWGVQQVPGVHPCIVPALFCGMEVTLGLLGLVTGIFFLVKGATSNTADMTKNKKKLLQ